VEKKAVAFSPDHPAGQPFPASFPPNKWAKKGGGGRISDHFAFALCSPGIMKKEDQAGFTSRNHRLKDFARRCDFDWPSRFGYSFHSLNFGQVRTVAHTK